MALDDSIKSMEEMSWSNKGFPIQISKIWAIYYKSLTWMFRPFWVGFPYYSLPFGVTSAEARFIDIFNVNGSYSEICGLHIEGPILETIDTSVPKVQGNMGLVTGACWGTSLLLSIHFFPKFAFLGDFCPCFLVSFHPPFHRDSPCSISQHERLASGHTTENDPRYQIQHNKQSCDI